MNGNQRQQLVVIGAGPGGYAAAFRAADLGLSVTLIDTRHNPGGCAFSKAASPPRACFTSPGSSRSQDLEDLGVEFPQPTST